MIRKLMNFFNRNQHEEILSPAGKLKGEINGEFEAFYLAVDKHGNFFKNTSLRYGYEEYAKSNGWEELSAKDLAKYLQHLSFVNKKQRHLHR